MDARPFRLALAVFCFAVTPVFCQEAAFESVVTSERSLDDLYRDLDALSQQVERLQAEQSAMAVPSPAAAPPAAKTFPSVKLTGFFQADTAWFSQDALNQITPAAGVPIGDLQDGADFRRARLAAVGDLTSNTSYMLEMDFAFLGRPSFMDVWVDVKDTFAPGTLRIGHWRQPFSMDALTSVKDLTFFERALPFAFLPFRQIGAEFYGENSRWDGTYGVSVFRFPTDPFGGNVGDNGGYGMATRWTWVPWASRDDSRLLHLGVGYTFTDPSSDVVRFRNTPEIFVSETGGSDILPPGVLPFITFFVDTGPIPTQNVNHFGAELAGILGPLHVQSEAMFVDVRQLDGSSNAFWGAYAQVGYFLTGEVRPYNHKAGVMGRATPFCPLTARRGWGAWEIAGRWSYIDLNDGAIAGNALTDLTAGLNWYLNKNLKWQLMYINASLDNLQLGRSEANIAALRVQADF